jgi:hypothetical protein
MALIIAITSRPVSSAIFSLLSSRGGCQRSRGASPRARSGGEAEPGRQAGGLADRCKEITASEANDTLAARDGDDQLSALVTTAASRLVVQKR